MALSFLQDRDENEVLGNLGAFAHGGASGASVQDALAVYRRDQKTHHEQSIASDLTRGLLRKIFRDTVLESSKQVKRKYSYSAVGSTVQEELDDANMGIMSKLKKLQKERLIVARLGFPDKAMEIDEAIEKIRADLRAERDKEDSRIMSAELAKLAVAHENKLSSLNMELKEDAKNKQEAFQQERAVLLRKQEKKFAQLVDDAIKRAIGKSKSCSCSKRYLCHHNKTASFNTRRPKKEVIHYRKNAKRLRHGGRLDESAAWEEKAAELDAEHLDKWREEVASSLTASAWGGSSSALDQLSSQHQREVNRMETAQANEWTLMLMRHQTLRRNCENVIMVERKKLRTTCKKNAEERHRREMLGVSAEMEQGALTPQNRSASTGPQVRGQDERAQGGGHGDEDIADMLRATMEEDATGGESAGAGGRPPTRPRSAPPARGRSPKVTQTAAVASGAGDPTVAAASGGVDKEAGHEIGDDDSSTGGSRDLRGFDELDGEFSYDQYPASGSPEEPEWIHVPWCGTNSGDIPIVDKLQTAPRPSAAGVTPCDSDRGSSGEGGRNTKGAGIGHGEGAGVGSESRTAARRSSTASSTGSARLAAAAAVEKLSKSGVVSKTTSCVSGAVAAEESEQQAISPPGTVVAGAREEVDRAVGAPPPRVVGSHKGLKRYDWDPSLVPARPALAAVSRIASGSRADKIKARNAKKRNPNRKAVSWGENVDVPPEPREDVNDEDLENRGNSEGDDGGHESTSTSFDDVVDGFVEDSSVDDEKEENRVPGSVRASTEARNARADIVRSDQAADDAYQGAEAGIDMMAAAAVAAVATGASAGSLDLDEGVQKGNKHDRCLTTSGKSPAPDVGGTRIVPGANKAAGEGASAGRISGGYDEEVEWRTQADPLQNALDQFCQIRALHGGWLSLLGQIAGEETCRNCLRRWSRARHCQSDVEACLQADVTRSADGSSVSWGSARAAAVAAASPSILAAFVAAPTGRGMFRTTAGRKAMGGKTVAEEPALGRSKRPWRTLFEGALGSLPHGAVLSLTGKGDGSGDAPVAGVGKTGRDDPSTAEAATGKVVWANEGFESLTGVDAVDVVGQQLGSLFEVGIEEGEKLIRSLEIGTRCSLWMTMAGQGQEPTDVLCLHQPVTVSPELSDEGRYSALLFFDTASVELEDEVEGGEGEGGGTEGDGRGERASVPHGKAKATREDDDRRGRRQQCCHDLCRAMSILLTDERDGRGDLSEDEDEDEALRRTRAKGTSAEEEGETEVHTPGNQETDVSWQNNDGLRRDRPDRGYLDGNSSGIDGEIGVDHGGAGEGGATGLADVATTWSTSPRRAEFDASLVSPPVRCDGDQSAFEAPRARGKAESSDASMKPSDSSAPGPAASEPALDARTRVQSLDEMRGKEQEEGCATAKTVVLGRGSLPADKAKQHNNTATADDVTNAVEYSSGDDSSAEPRDDLVVSPQRSAVTGLARPAGETTAGRGASRAVDDDPTSARESLSKSPPDESEIAGSSRHKSSGISSDGGDDQYEDDFFSDEESPTAPDVAENVYTGVEGVATGKQILTSAQQHHQQMTEKRGKEVVRPDDSIHSAVGERDSSRALVVVEPSASSLPWREGNSAAPLLAGGGDDIEGGRKPPPKKEGGTYTDVVARDGSESEDNARRSPGGGDAGANSGDDGNSSGGVCSSTSSTRVVGVGGVFDDVDEEWSDGSDGGWEISSPPRATASSFDVATPHGPISGDIGSGGGRGGGRGGGGRDDFEPSSWSRRAQATAARAAAAPVRPK